MSVSTQEVVDDARGTLANHFLLPRNTHTNDHFLPQSSATTL